MFVEFILDMISKSKPPYDITGLLMAYPGFMLIILEAPIESLLSVMRGLSDSELILNQALTTYNSLNSHKINKEDEEKSETWSDDEVIRTMVKDPNSAPIIRSRILCTLYNISTRMFRTFEMTKLKVEPLRSPSFYEAEEDERKLMTMLQKLDSEDFVPEIYRMRMTALLSNLLDDYPEMVPNLADVWYFGEVSKIECLLSVVEYVDRNDKPDQLTDPEGMVSFSIYF
ncbi:unnamed protein product [Hymenolepis diminuta]|uniref:RYDR_ITPR domain-containing protein n=1 Tax=Hymenolepis diminuta TaxID=6216 RepID=A0A0R3SBB8_HYMDI|nr:unnamed protein product [Hymenolepis diminuta]